MTHRRVRGLVVEDRCLIGQLITSSFLIMCHWSIDHECCWLFPVMFKSWGSHYSVEPFSPQLHWKQILHVFFTILLSYNVKNTKKKKILYISTLFHWYYINPDNVITMQNANNALVVWRPYTLCCLCYVLPQNSKYKHNINIIKT